MTCKCALSLLFKPQQETHCAVFSQKKITAYKWALVFELVILKNNKIIPVQKKQGTRLYLVYFFDRYKTVPISKKTVPTITLGLA